MYFEDERDAEDAIRKLDNFPFGYEKRRLSVEWAKVFFFFLVFIEAASYLRKLLKFLHVFRVNVAGLVVMRKPLRT